MKSLEGNFAVKFSSKVARVIECENATTRITFTVDSGGEGSSSICLEHHPEGSQSEESYNAAFEAAKQYLLSCGYEVEVYGRQNED